jgi:hypothetical protein
MENHASSNKDKMGLNSPREMQLAIIMCGSPGSATVPVSVTRTGHASLSTLLPTSSAIHLRPYSHQSKLLRFPGLQGTPTQELRAPVETRTST